MKYLLDTNVIIDFLRNVPSVVEKVLNLENNDGLSISVITLAEYWQGAHQSRSPGKNIELFDEFIRANSIQVWEVTPEIAKIYGEEQANLSKKGLRLPGFDLLIASTCLHHHLTMVTENKKDFERIPKLSVV